MVRVGSKGGEGSASKDGAGGEKSGFSLGGEAFAELKKNHEYAFVDLHRYERPAGMGSGTDVGFATFPLFSQYVRDTPDACLKLCVISTPDASVNSALHMSFHCGAVDGTSNFASGIPHLVEHMVFEGSMKFGPNNTKPEWYDNAGKSASNDQNTDTDESTDTDNVTARESDEAAFRLFFKVNGGNSNACTTDLRTQVYGSFASPKIEEGIERMFDAGFNPTFPPHCVMKELVSIDQEFLGELYSHELRMLSAIKACAKPDHPLHRSFICGNTASMTKDIESASEVDIALSLVERCRTFHTKYWLTSDVTLVVVSNRKVQEIVKIVHKALKEALLLKIQTLKAAKFGKEELETGTGGDGELGGLLPVSRPPQCPPGPFGPSTLPRLVLLELDPPTLANSSAGCTIEYRFVLPDLRRDPNRTMAVNFLTFLVRQTAAGGLRSILLSIDKISNCSIVRGIGGLGQSFLDAEFSLLCQIAKNELCVIGQVLHTFFQYVQANLTEPRLTQQWSEFASLKLSNFRIQSYEAVEDMASAVCEEVSWAPEPYLELDKDVNIFQDPRPALEFLEAPGALLRTMKEVLDFTQVFVCVGGAEQQLKTIFDEAMEELAKSAEGGKASFEKRTFQLEVNPYYLSRFTSLPMPRQWMVEEILEAYDPADEFEFDPPNPYIPPRPIAGSRKPKQVAGETQALSPGKSSLLTVPEPHTSVITDRDGIGGSEERHLEASPGGTPAALALDKSYDKERVKLFVYRQQETSKLAVVAMSVCFFLPCLAVRASDLEGYFRQSSTVTRQVGSALRDSGALVRVAMGEIITEALRRRLQILSMKASKAGLVLSLDLTTPLTDGSVALTLDIQGFRESAELAFKDIFEVLLSQGLTLEELLKARNYLLQEIMQGTTTTAAILDETYKLIYLPLLATQTQSYDILSQINRPVLKSLTQTPGGGTELLPEGKADARPTHQTSGQGLTGPSDGAQAATAAAGAIARGTSRKNTRSGTLKRTLGGSEKGAVAMRTELGKSGTLAETLDPAPVQAPLVDGAAATLAALFDDCRVIMLASGDIADEEIMESWFQRVIEATFNKIGVSFERVQSTGQSASQSVANIPETSTSQLPGAFASQSPGKPEERLETVPEERLEKAPERKNGLERRRSAGGEGLRRRSSLLLRERGMTKRIVALDLPALKSENFVELLTASLKIDKKVCEAMVKTRGRKRSLSQSLSLGLKKGPSPATLQEEALKAPELRKEPKPLAFVYAFNGFEGDLSSVHFHVVKRMEDEGFERIFFCILVEILEEIFFHRIREEKQLAYYLSAIATRRTDETNSIRFSVESQTDMVIVINEIIKMLENSSLFAALTDEEIAKRLAGMAAGFREDPTTLKAQHENFHKAILAMAIKGGDPDYEDMKRTADRVDEALKKYNEESKGMGKTEIKTRKKSDSNIPADSVPKDSSPADAIPADSSPAASSPDVRGPDSQSRVNAGDKTQALAAHKLPQGPWTQHMRKDIGSRTEGSADNTQNSLENRSENNVDGDTHIHGRPEVERPGVERPEVERSRVERPKAFSVEDAEKVEASGSSNIVENFRAYSERVRAQETWVIIVRLIPSAATKYNVENFTGESGATTLEPPLFIDHLDSASRALVQLRDPRSLHRIVLGTHRAASSAAAANAGSTKADLEETAKKMAAPFLPDFYI